MYKLILYSENPNEKPIVIEYYYKNYTSPGEVSPLADPHLVHIDDFVALQRKHDSRWALYSLSFMDKPYKQHIIIYSEDPKFKPVGLIIEASMAFDNRIKVPSKLPVIKEPIMIHVSDIKIERGPTLFGGLDPVKPFYKFYQKTTTSFQLDGFTFIGWARKEDAPGRIEELSE
jgi:hypothetical protein